MGQDSATSQKDDSGPVDTRPESSPYASPLITLHFADGPPLTVPVRLIDKSPKLSLDCGYDMTLRLAHIPGDAGHVLVHYLFTGTYECLKPRGSSCYEKDAAEFATGARVYAIARDCGLPGLESIARSEMERLGYRLRVTHIIDVLKDALPSPSVDDMWLKNFLQSLVRSFITTPPASPGSLTGSAGQTLSFPNALLRAIVELWHEKTDSPSSGLNNIDISHDHRDESAATHIEDSEPNPTTISKPTPEHEDFDTKLEEVPKKMSKKEKKQKRMKEKLSDSIGIGWQNHSKWGEDHAEEDKDNGIAPATFLTTNIIPTSETAASHAKWPFLNKDKGITPATFLTTNIIPTSEPAVLNARWLQQIIAANNNKELELKLIPQPSSLFSNSFGTSSF
ncbi:hypothetical protein F4777DRAFT_581785 [Nemania sp. FL0916]|nr:hypothetical protein F4777DRAFT_581785 [Nemania sp. FL0916]